MRRIASIGAAFLLILALVFNPLFKVGAIVHRKWQMSYILEEKVKSLSTVKLIIKKSEFARLAKGQEINYGSSKYDILAVSESTECWTVVAVDDVLEKRLEKSIERDFGNSGPLKSNHKFKTIAADWNIHLVPDFAFVTNNILILFQPESRKTLLGFADDLLRPPRVTA